MNIVSGVITRIVKHDCFNYTSVKARGKSDFVVLTLELKDSFRENAAVSMMFKESDVIVAKGSYYRLSVENRFACLVTSITAGDVFVELELKTSFGIIRSLIDFTSYKQLNIVFGDKLNAYIKANEISLMVDT
jgi:molybdate transport system regulatory protein